MVDNVTKCIKTNHTSNKQTNKQTSNSITRKKMKTDITDANKEYKFINRVFPYLYN